MSDELQGYLKYIGTALIGVFSYLGGRHLLQFVNDWRRTTSDKHASEINNRVSLVQLDDERLVRWQQAVELATDRIVTLKTQLADSEIERKHLEMHKRHMSGIIAECWRQMQKEGIDITEMERRMEGL